MSRHKQKEQGQQATRSEQEVAELGRSRNWFELGRIANYNPSEAVRKLAREQFKNANSGDFTRLAAQGDSNASRAIGFLAQFGPEWLAKTAREWLFSQGMPLHGRASE